MLAVHKIVEAIELCCDELVANGVTSNRVWTSEIKQKVVNFARENDNNFCICTGGTEINNKDHDEWLYDITIIKMLDNELVEYIDTVIESEWGDVKDILDDFQKVMQSSARNKIMICQDSKLSAIQIVDKLQAQLNAYQDFCPSSEIYVLCFENSNKTFVHSRIAKQR